MGFIQKKDEEKDFIGDIEVIGRGEGPDDIEVSEIELHEGATAEDISGTTAAREGELETEADPELLEDVDDEDDAAFDSDVVADADADADAAAAVAACDDAAESDEDEDTDMKTTLFTGDADGTGTVRPTKLMWAIGAVAVVVALIIGYVVGSGGFGSKGASAAELTEGELDTVVASWNYNGAKHEITAREAIESQYSLDAVKTDDDTYPTPSADSVMSYVRNEVLLAEAAAQGISVDDDELAATAEDSLGMSDFSEIATQYGVSEDQAKEIIRQQAMIQKLYNTIIKDAPVAPTAPEEPEDGDTTTATAAYAEYIIGLAGDEWDAEAGTWASTDGAIATALADSGFTGETASYELAQTAYYAAYQEYSIEASSSTTEWTSYVNNLFAKVDLSLYGLFA